MTFTYESLPNNFFEIVRPTHFKNPEILNFNIDLAAELNLNFKDATDEGLAKIFSGQQDYFGEKKISLAYAGHQFGNFVHQLGDGRAMLIGQAKSKSGKIFDIQLKGSGPTPYSRRGDGFSALGPVLREYLVSEAMWGLGIPATRALAAVQSGQGVLRESRLAGGVFTRVAESHIRIGSFEYFYVREDFEGLKKLLDYVIQYHYPECLEAEEPYLDLIKRVADRQLELVAKWMGVGFVHGVMNTDNMSIVGETIDFGPCAFLDEFRFDKVFSSIDSGGRYSYASQGSIALWNLSVFGNCLWPVLGKDREQSILKVKSVLEKLPNIFLSYWLSVMTKKMGIFSPDKNDIELVQNFLEFLEERELDYTQSFTKLGELISSDESTFFGDSEKFREFLVYWKLRLKMQGDSESNVLNLMKSVNPIIIPRNHLVEKAIQLSYQGDKEFFKSMHLALKSPYNLNFIGSEWDAAPAADERITATFCGT